MMLGELASSRSNLYPLVCNETALSSIALFWGDGTRESSTISTSSLGKLSKKYNTLSITLSFIRNFMECIISHLREPLPSGTLTRSILKRVYSEPTTYEIANHRCESRTTRKMPFPSYRLLLETFEPPHNHVAIKIGGGMKIPCHGL